MEGKIDSASYEGFQSRKDLGNGSGYSSYKEVRHSAKENSRDMTQIPHPNGVLTNDGDILSEQLGAYHHLLKDGRYMLYFTSLISTYEFVRMVLDFYSNFTLVEQQ